MLATRRTSVGENRRPELEKERSRKDQHYCGGLGVAGAGFAGVVGAGVVGAGVAGAAGRGGAGVPLTIDPGPRCPMIASASAPSMNNTAITVVAFESTVAPARAPNAD